MLKLKNCVDALPVALMSYHMQANRMTHPTPHEMLTGRLMPSPTFRGPRKGAIRHRIKNYMFDN